jgi:peptidoglycan/LPS O-acetylase OafA/YrhL
MKKGERYRPQLDGIRAVAVLLVVGYHLGFAVVPGGFTGVDVFFVLSGYLISGLLLAEAAVTGRIRVGRFYARRARRLLPAAVVVVLFCLVMDRYTYSPIDYPHLRRHATAAALYVANWDVAGVDNGYFSTDTQTSPLVHFWSLAVEEQFYIVWPALVVLGIGLAHLFHRRVDQVLLVAFGAVTAASLAAALLLPASPYTYYGTHTRAFELSAGAVLAVLMHRRSRIGERSSAGSGSEPPSARTRWGADVLGLGGLAAGLVLAATVTGSDTYPGVAAILVTAAALALIAGADLTSGSLTARLLSTPLATWLGRLSYSIYLWHWPLIVFFADDLPTPLLVLAILVASQASYTLIEQPIRTRTFPRAPSFAVVLTGLSTSTAVALVVVPAYLHNSPRQQVLIDEFAHQQQEQEQQETAVRCLPEVNYEADHLTCVLHRGHGPTVALVGDSHATMWAPGLLDLARRDDWTLVRVTHPGCPANAVDQYWEGREDECAPWRKHAFSELTERHDVDVVLLATRSYQMKLADDSGVLDPGQPAHVRAWDQAWDPTLQALGGRGVRIGVFQAQPTLPQGVLACLAEHPPGTTDCDFLLSADPLLATYQDALRDAVERSPGVTLLDPTAWICPGGTCPALIDGERVHIDDNHVSEEFVLAHERELGILLRQVGLGVIGPT